MAWTSLTFVSCGVLTAGMMTQLQENFAALANGQPSAPPIAVNSLVWSGVASGADLVVSSHAALRNVTASNVASLAEINVSSMGTFRMLAVSQVASIGVLGISGTPPASPSAGTLYKHPTAGSKGFAVPMDPASAVPSIQGVYTQAQGSAAAGAMAPWHVVGAASEPPFEYSGLGNWYAVQTIAFRKFPDGNVRLTGIAGALGTINTTIFTLPQFFRPSSQRTFAVFDYDGGVTLQLGIVKVTAAGAVIPILGNPAQVGLDNIEFFAEA